MTPCFLHCHYYLSCCTNISWHICTPCWTVSSVKAGIPAIYYPEHSAWNRLALNKCMSNICNSLIPVGDPVGPCPFPSAYNISSCWLLLLLALGLSLATWAGQAGGAKAQHPQPDVGRTTWISQSGALRPKHVYFFSQGRGFNSSCYSCSLLGSAPSTCFLLFLGPCCFPPTWCNTCKVLLSCISVSHKVLMGYHRRVRAMLPAAFQHKQEHVGLMYKLNIRFLHRI